MIPLPLLLPLLLHVVSDSQLGLFLQFSLEVYYCGSSLRIVESETLHTRTELEMILEEAMNIYVGMYRNFIEICMYS